MAFADDALALIQQKQFEELESLWMNQLETDPGDVAAFLRSAKALRKAEQRTQSDTLLSLLAEMLLERKLWPQRLTVLEEMGRLSKHPAQIRPAIEEALRNAFAGRKNFQRAFEFSGFADPSNNPVEKAEKIESWMQYEEGSTYFMAGRGAGVVVELNPQLGICRLDFEKDKRVSVPLGAAAKFLVPISGEHVLHGKFSDPAKLRAEALKSAPAFFARILQSFGRPMLMAEVRDAVIGIVPDEKWSSWWTAARKNPQIVVSGSGAKATYSWSSSTGEAESRIRHEFERADPKGKLELARKHSARGSELADFFSSSLAGEAARLARSDAATAWQILTTLESLPGRYTPALDPGSLLSGPMAARAVAAISDKPMRERALGVVRNVNPDWPKVYGELFFLDEEPRILSAIVATLEREGHGEIRDRLVDETLRYPRRHPRAFYWYVKQLEEQDPLPERANYGLIFQMLEAVSSDEFAPVRARLKDLFDKGGLVIRIIMSVDHDEQARK
ncbi:MAG TPA: hypothetical protein VKH35_03770, partial [Thermoanaerobaculia bacterium]|nr:hypothetical protein [Thermoanaerobaculia bacterium]